MQIKNVLHRLKTMLRPVQTPQPAAPHAGLVVRTDVRAGLTAAEEAAWQARKDMVNASGRLPKLPWR
jgi:hypothetical protein